MQTTVSRTQPTIYRVLRIIARGIAIMISACIVLAWLAFFMFVFWAVINS
jgi:hypothetical protein